MVLKVMTNDKFKTIIRIDPSQSPQGKPSTEYFDSPSPYRLVLDGLLLPRIDNAPMAFGKDGDLCDINHYQFWLDEKGNPQIPSNGEEQQKLHGFRIGNGGDNWHISRGNGQSKFRLVKELPLNLDKAGCYQALPSPDLKNYHAIIERDPIPFDLPPEVIVLGREDPNPNAIQADLCLDYIVNASKTLWQNGKETGGDLGRWQLSRRQLCMVVEGGILRVGYVPPMNAKVYRVRNNSQTAEPLEPVYFPSHDLLPGDALLVGCYRFRFEADDQENELSTDDREQLNLIYSSQQEKGSDQLSQTHPKGVTDLVLGESAHVLALWLDEFILKNDNDWWEKYVKRAFSPDELKDLIKNNQSTLMELDLIKLLHVLKYHIDMRNDRLLQIT